MRFPLSNLAMTAGIFASTAAGLTAQDIHSDTPVSVLLTSAQTHLAQGQTSDALVYYDAAIAKDPNNYLTLFKRATAYLSIGRSSQATDDFNKVLALKPGFQGAHVQLAKIKLKTADWKGAREQYVAANKAEDSEELVQLAEAEAGAAAAREAAEAQQWQECVTKAGVAILAAPRAVELRELRSRCRFERGEIEEGMGDLQHVLHLKPGDTTPHVVISATSFYALSDFENGLAQIRKCLHSDPESKVCKALHKQEKAFHKKFGRAEGQLKKGQSTTAGRTIVGTSEEAGLLAIAKEQFDALAKDGMIPTHASSRLHSTLTEMACQAYTESSHKNTAQYCDETLTLNPDSFWGLLHKGKALLKQDEFEAAIQTLNQAAEAHPDKRDKVNPVLQKAQIALKRSKTKDYYKVLGVASDADERQIKSAYRKASKIHHPDKAAKQGISKEDAEKKMASINEAYEVLSNPELRARFDNGDDPNSQEQGNPFQGSPFGGGGHPFMFQQGGGGGGQQFKFHFGGGGGGGGHPFGF